MDEAEQGLHDLLFERLLADESADDEVSGLVLAAWAGEEELAAALSGRPTPGPDPAGAEPGPPHRDVFLAAVDVEGFRGVGKRATLPLRPGPGLTLVTGRNGSGKSSFAEAAELVLTGSSGRWSGRTTVWREGWRNLHSDGSTSIGVDLITAGTSGTTRIERTWQPADELDGGRWTRQANKGKREGFDGSAWGADMQTYRPFLSYSELGALIEGKPSELHDALRNLLGLGALTATQDRIGAARKELSDRAKAVGAQRRALRTALADSADPRIARALALLKLTSPDLAAVAELISGSSDPDNTAAALRDVLALQLPSYDDVRSATTRIRERADVQNKLAATELDRADRIARLLREALHEHIVTGTSKCPVCEQGTLDDAWRTTATARVTELEQTAADLRQATVQLNEAIAAGRALTRAVPAALTADLSIDGNAARLAWRAWAQAGPTDGPAALAQALEETYPLVFDAVAQLRERAEEELARRDETLGSGRAPAERLARRRSGRRRAGESARRPGEGRGVVVGDRRAAARPAPRPVRRAIAAGVADPAPAEQRRPRTGPARRRQGTPSRHTWTSASTVSMGAPRSG